MDEGKRRDYIQLTTLDLEKYDVWVAPDGDFVEPWRDGDDEFYPEFFVKCELFFADGTVHPGLASVFVSSTPRITPGKCLLPSNMWIILSWVRLFGKLKSIGTRKTPAGEKTGGLRSREYFQELEKEWGKTEAEIFPLRIRISAKRLGFECDFIEEHPYD